MLFLSIIFLIILSIMTIFGAFDEPYRPTETEVGSLYGNGIISHEEYEEEMSSIHS